MDADICCSFMGDLTLIGGSKNFDLGIYGDGLNSYVVSGCCANSAYVSTFTHSDWENLHALYLGPNHIYISRVDWNNYIFLLHHAPASSFPPGLLEKAIVLSLQREQTYLNSANFYGNFSDILIHNHLKKNTEFLDIRTYIRQLKNMDQYNKYTLFLESSNLNGIYTTSHSGGLYPSTFPKFDCVEKKFVESQNNFIINDFKNLNLHLRVATFENLEILTTGMLPYSEDLAYSLAQEGFLKDYKGILLNPDNVPSFSNIFASDYSAYDVDMYSDSDSDSDSDFYSDSGYSSIEDFTLNSSHELSSLRSDSD